MKEMGFQACCLRCDAADVAASIRCKRCISRHTSIRDQIAAVSHDDPFTQFAKEMLMMAAAPHRYDHDEVHRAVLVEQQHLAAGLSEPVQKSTIEDIEELSPDLGYYIEHLGEYMQKVGCNPDLAERYESFQKEIMRNGSIK